MKKILLILIFNFAISSQAFSHSGNTNAGGCHMNYVTSDYHCHNTKQTNPYQIYYYIKHMGSSYGPYSSYNSCTAAIRGANILGAYCTSSPY